MLRLLELIEEAGITQKKLSEDVHLAPQTINNYVKGNRIPDLDKLVRLCDYFDCSLDYLLGRSDVKRPYVTREEVTVLAAYRAADADHRLIVDTALGLHKEQAAVPAKKNAVS